MSHITADAQGRYTTGTTEFGLYRIRETSLGFFGTDLRLTIRTERATAPCP